MKKYIKPELFYERYELAQHIADCAWELDFATKETCIAESDPNHLGEQPPLFTAQANCDLLDTDWEDYCYQPGAEGTFKVFRS